MLLGVFFNEIKLKNNENYYSSSLLIYVILYGLVKTTIVCRWFQGSDCIIPSFRLVPPGPVVQPSPRRVFPLRAVPSGREGAVQVQRDLHDSQSHLREVADVVHQLQSAAYCVCRWTGSELGQSTRRIRHLFCRFG